jgi:hypothetical protein
LMSRKKSISRIIFLLFMVLAVLFSYSVETPSEAITKPGTVKNIKVKIYQPDKRVTGNSGIAKWDVVKHADGYQIVVYTTIWKNDKWSSYNISTIKTKKTVYNGSGCYYLKLKIRAYRKVNGKRVYGKWTTSKKYYLYTTHDYQ